MDEPGTVIGALGAPFRATVSPWGSVHPWGPNGRTLDWWVAADDRWHTPPDEPSTRQRLLDGTPVVETSVRVPGGDAIATTYVVADHGGLTVTTVENRSSLPIAIAFGRRDLLTTRPPTDVPTHGIALPAEAIVLPIGHQSTITVALAHDGRGAGALPAGLPSAAQVARGWLTQIDRSWRVVLPDDAVAERLVSARAELLLVGPPDPVDEPGGFLHAVGELTALGEPADPWVDDVVVVAERLGRRHRRDQRALSWIEHLGLLGAEHALRRAGDPRAADDVRSLSARLTAAQLPGLPPEHAPLDAAGFVAWWQQRLARPVGSLGVQLLPEVPTTWFGQGIEAHRLPVPGGLLGFAVRWHGARPALLWDADVDLHLRCPGLDPTWSSSQRAGDALLAEPVA
jgi:hypothetical protein